MKLSVVIPFYDDLQETENMAEAVRRSIPAHLDFEILKIDLRGNPSLPWAKNKAANDAKGEYVLFLLPGIFPKEGAIEILVARLDQDQKLAAVAGSWRNAAGKLEIGYNVRRFPTFQALIFDILLLNKVFPRNEATRRFKMHDFDHKSAIQVEHANDCALLVRRGSILRHSFNTQYAPGWFDQLEFCQSLHQAGEQILYEPCAGFVSNEKVPLIDRLVERHYAEYRRAEQLYIRNHFGRFAGYAARAAVAAGMVGRIGFSIALPNPIRKWFLSTLRSYVDDEYVRSLRRSYWTVLRDCFRGDM